MLREPVFDYPRTDRKSNVRLEDGHYRLYLDRKAALELLFSLHWLTKEQPIWEEVDIRTRHETGLPCSGKSIGVCELNLVPAHMHKKQGKTILKQAQTIRNTAHGVYTEEHDRFDYFVSPEEVQGAYEMLTALLVESQDRKRIPEATLFQTLTVRLVTLSQPARKL
jgi:hypothetical protein